MGMVRLMRKLFTGLLTLSLSLIILGLILYIVTLVGLMALSVVYNDKDECVYQVDDIFSLDAGESKYTDLDMCPDYSYTEIKVFEVY